MQRGPYQALFDEYVSNLAWAVKEAQRARQEDFLAFEEASDADQSRAEELLDAEGSISADPYVLGAVRQAWLSCAALNTRYPHEAIPPVQLVYAELRATHPDLAAVVGGLPYWPIGQDEYGRFV